MNVFGYETQTTFWQDFSVAEIPWLGDPTKNIKDTFNRAFKEWKANHVYLTELVMVLNWKMWNWSERGNYERSKLYQTLWEKADSYAMNHLKGDELSYFIRTTD